MIKYVLAYTYLHTNRFLLLEQFERRKQENWIHDVTRVYLYIIYVPSHEEKHIREQKEISTQLPSTLIHLPHIFFQLPYTLRRNCFGNPPKYFSTASLSSSSGAEHFTLRCFFKCLNKKSAAEMPRLAAFWVRARAHKTKSNPSSGR